MAGNVKKGFGAYLLVLFFAIVATFLTIVVIMLFSPFKEVLGFKYFVYDDVVSYDNVKSDKTESVLDFSTIEQINIDSDFASVSVYRSKDVDNISFQFINRSKGFARGDQNTDFNYDIDFSDDSTSILNVIVKEPAGFLYFSKSVEINLLVPVNSTYAFENTSININNRSGSIYIGNKEAFTSPESASYINMKSLNIKTISGTLMLNQCIGSNLEDLFIKSQNGDINIVSNLVVNNELQIFTGKNRIEMHNITLNNPDKNIVLNINDSQLYADTINGNVDLNTRSGYIKVTNLNGSLKSNDSLQQMDYAKIKIQKVENGNISLPYANNSNVTIDEISSVATGDSFAKGEVYIHSTRGNVYVGKTNAKTWIETTSGNIYVDTTSSDLNLKTVSGNIEIKYHSLDIANQLDIQTTSGKILMFVQSDLAFKLKVYDTSLSLRDPGEIYVESFASTEIDGELIVNNGSKLIRIVSDTKVEIKLF